MIIQVAFEIRLLSATSSLWLPSGFICNSLAVFQIFTNACKVVGDHQMVTAKTKATTVNNCSIPTLSFFYLMSS